MTPLQGLAIAGAGLFAGTINTIVGSGSLVTFPVLLGLGYPPLVANVSNTVGLVPGSLSAVLGQREELGGQRARLLRLGACSAAGGLLGGLLLLARPSAFRAIVPWLVILAALLMAVQPRLSAYLRREPRRPHSRSRVLLPLLVLVTGVYGGYFGAAQGVVLLAVLGLLEDDTLQRLNATKNVLAGLVNTIAAVLFVLVTHVAWEAALVLALGAILGGQLGARVARRISDAVLRWVVVVGGLTVGVVLAVR